MIPTLETERLVLRGWRKEDFPAHAAFYADHKRMRYMGGPKSEWEAWTVFAAMLGEWVLSGYGLFAVQLRETRSVIGRVGLWHPSYLDEPELAWSLYAGFDGRGYATEAARRVQVWTARDIGLPALMSFVHPENLPSQAVARRLGATLLPATTLCGEPHLRFRHRLPT
ncbi:MAG: GNAT family N-acetyltransferase [Mesorhizobium sp.]|uniref:GNAT family N-acetyltransferase n=1 Tax=Mesorhizobium TaxID=68287 RepID=UPI000FD2798D|nr:MULTISPECIES: GNAT family N-acetyltransferase [Mesorhizobium]RUV97314.1 N-acetyltransferase [Mesorhizobium sp. M5C.F.Ca.IN.020.14.1.1]MCF6117428.1 GNAT family N-acetyltransferase [Mesorhizobium muleiense]RWE99206.1 MAG: N-acetyltransferase [Mesorhizobium sp.]RWL14760.1 MAG: N-acetyltransferase [Mesorhizobium sp.]TIL92988.1 MAG: GNAT family N-acetyltransferase [Mesorhizobium sp.]